MQKFMPFFFFLNILIFLLNFCFSTDIAIFTSWKFQLYTSGHSNAKWQGLNRIDTETNNTKGNFSNLPESPGVLFTDRSWIFPSDNCWS